MVSAQIGSLFLLEFLKGPFWDLCFFLIYINDLPEGLKSNAKLFTNHALFYQLLKTKKKVPVI